MRRSFVCDGYARSAAKNRFEGAVHADDRATRLYHETGRGKYRNVNDRDLRLDIMEQPPDATMPRHVHDLAQRYGSNYGDYITCRRQRGRGYYGRESKWYGMLQNVRIDSNTIA